MPNDLLPRLPNELLLWVAEILESRNDRETLASLSQTCNSVWLTTAPILFQTVTITRPRHLSGLLINFTTDPRIADNGITTLGRARGLYLLRSINHITLASMPNITRIGVQPPTSDWHNLMILAHHYQVLKRMKRLDRLAITKEAVLQLEPVELEPGSHVEEVIMPSDGLLPSSNDPELSFFPQGALPLRTIIALTQPRHVTIELPFKSFRAPSEFPIPRIAVLTVPLELHRPHEWVLRQALEGLRGDTTLCAHGLIDQLIPIGKIGSRHFISFAAYPTVQPQYAEIAESYPSISIPLRTAQIKEVIRRSNPHIPDPETCVNGTSAGEFEKWEESKKGTWTIYRPGAMVWDGRKRWEWTFGAEIERRVRLWISLEYTVEDGHPPGLPEDINERLTFVHCGLQEDPDSLTCEACEYVCTATID